uniref:Transposase Tc1-like domain-containing protein n=1 Tax=Sinocyclocheilus grahami TaxID=75366 RepID=A0A672RUE1_SINGR
ARKVADAVGTFRRSGSVSRWHVGGRQRDETGVRVLRARRPAVRAPLSRAHKLAHLQWTTEHCRWTLNEWGTVLFTDESQFCVNFLDRRRRVWRHPGERNVPQNVVQHDSFGGSSVMVWGGISMEGQSLSSLKMAARQAKEHLILKFSLLMQSLAKHPGNYGFTAQLIMPTRMIYVQK